jgi:hypothetical protein
MGSQSLFELWLGRANMAATDLKALLFVSLQPGCSKNIGRGNRHANKKGSFQHVFYVALGCERSFQNIWLF